MAKSNLGTRWFQFGLVNECMFATEVSQLLICLHLRKQLLRFTTNYNISLQCNWKQIQLHKNGVAKQILQKENKLLEITGRNIKSCLRGTRA